MEKINYSTIEEEPEINIDRNKDSYYIDEILLEDMSIATDYFQDENDEEDEEEDYYEEEFLNGYEGSFQKIKKHRGCN